MTAAPETDVPPLLMRLQGGLGNQLFQFAAANELERLFDRALAFETSSFGGDAYGRRCHLERLCPGATSVRLHDLRPEALAACARVREADLPTPAVGQGPTRLGMPAGLRHLVLDGYWQDTRWVDPASVQRLRAALAAAARAEAAPLQARIEGSARPVALHVRRHDYKHHGLCTENYHLDALTWLEARLGPLDLFVFTDEPNYTRHLLVQAGRRFTPVASGCELTDLWLMSRCRAHVIANSSYSWWGARMADSQQVVAPLPWSLVGSVSPSLLPAHWTRVEHAVERHLNPRRYLQAAA